MTIKADSIDTRVQKRDNHLRNNHFPDIQHHPEITLASTVVEQVEDANYKLTGDLTVGGVTKPVTIDFEFTVVDDPGGNKRAGSEGSVTINRKDWVFNWNAAVNGGGVLISDKVTLEFDVFAVKES